MSNFYLDAQVMDLDCLTQDNYEPSQPISSCISKTAATNCTNTPTITTDPSSLSTNRVELDNDHDHVLPSSHGNFEHLTVTSIVQRQLFP